MSFDFPFKTLNTLCSVIKIMMMIHKKNGSVVYSWIPLLTKIPVKIIMKTSPSIRTYTMLYILAVPAARRSVQNYLGCQWDSTIYTYIFLHACIWKHTCIARVSFLCVTSKLWCGEVGRWWRGGLLLWSRLHTQYYYILPGSVTILLYYYGLEICDWRF